MEVLIAGQAGVALATGHAAQGHPFAGRQGVIGRVDTLLEPGDRLRRAGHPPFHVTARHHFSKQGDVAVTQGAGLAVLPEIAGVGEYLFRHGGGAGQLPGTPERDVHDRAIALGHHGLHTPFVAFRGGDPPFDHVIDRVAFPKGVDDVPAVAVNAQAGPDAPTGAAVIVGIDGDGGDAVVIAVERIQLEAYRQLIAVEGQRQRHQIRGVLHSAGITLVTGRGRKQAWRIGHRVKQASTPRYQIGHRQRRQSHQPDIGAVVIVNIVAVDKRAVTEFGGTRYPAGLVAIHRNHFRFFRLFGDTGGRLPRGIRGWWLTVGATTTAGAE